MMPKPTRLTKIVRKMTSSGRVIDLRRALAGARTAVVARRRVREIGQPRARLVDQSGNAHQLAELDPGRLVGVRVVVGMQPGGEEDHRNALGRVTVVIAAIVELFGI